MMPEKIFFVILFLLFKMWMIKKRNPSKSFTELQFMGRWTLLLVSEKPMEADTRGEGRVFAPKCGPCAEEGATHL